MVKIPGGTYTMGTHKPLFTYRDNYYLHKVVLSSFYFSKYLTSGQQYNSYLKLTHQSKRIPNKHQYQRFGKYPATTNWTTAYSFCKWIGKNTGLPLSLSTEAQWEYVARNLGKNDDYATQDGTIQFGKNYPTENDFINPHDKKWGAMPMRVTGPPINALGIHQLGGNESEWLHDIYEDDYYQYSSIHNPQGPIPTPQQVKDNLYNYGGQPRAIRGKDYLDTAGFTDSEVSKKTHQYQIGLGLQSNYIRLGDVITSDLNGFRCVINSAKPMSQLLKIAKQTQQSAQNK